MRLGSIDCEISALQARILFNGNRGVCRSNRNADSSEILLADPECNRLVTGYSLERNGSQSSNNIRLHLEFSLDDLARDLQCQANDLFLHTFSELLMRHSELSDGIFIPLHNGLHH